MVVGGETIAIVTPRLKEPGPKGEWWNTAIVRVHGFTLHELPFTEPLSNAGMAIGEDLSTRQAIAAKWSAPGLGRHRRCALAVLTANHVLSIWTADKESDTNDSWSRKVLVNDTIRDYYRRHEAEDNARNEDARQKAEKRQIQQRIRSFGWSPPLRKETDTDKLSEYVDWGQHFLAVATEGGDIFVLRVQSPHEGLDREQPEWRVEVALTFSVKDAVGPAGVSDSAAEASLDAEQAPIIADHMSWGTWRWQSATTSGGIACSALAYITAGRLFTASLQASNISRTAEIKTRAESRTRHYLTERADLSGPLRTIPGREYDHLLLFGIDTVFHVDLDPADRDDTVSLHHLDGRWDEVSGVAITNAGDGRNHLHVVSNLTSSTADTPMFELPLNHSEVLSLLPAWQEILNESREVYSTEHELQGNVQERTYGIAASPLGQYVATCFTLHTSDGLEYVIATNQKSTLSITYESRLDEGALMATPRATALLDPVSVETLLFDMQSQYRKIVGEEEPDDDSREVIVADILRNMPRAPNIAGYPDANDRSALSFDGLTHLLRIMLFAHPRMREQRASRLADFVVRKNTSRHSMARPVVQQVVEEVAKLPTELVRMDALSSRIMNIHATIRAKLMAQPTAATTASTDTVISEDCQICQQPIPFESLRWSKCSTGHEFARCALSFLSIQEPGITKSCGICDLQILKDSTVADVTSAAEDIEMTDVPAPEGDEEIPADDTWVEISHNQDNKDLRPKMTLAQLLFNACDVCIYCGGKFS